MSTPDLSKIRQHIKRGHFEAFEDLFIEELGWDDYNGSEVFSVDGTDYILEAVAQKRGMVVFSCEHIPDHPTRQKIERQVAKLHRENFIIFTKNGRQVWHWAKREPGQPVKTRTRTVEAGHDGHGLAQALSQIAFTLAEEDNLSIVEVSGRVRATFDVERVTKKFYKLFKKQHDAFLDFIQGIPDDDLQRWYASVMLNRLMFIYFVQRKGFLDNDINYLQTRLAQIEAEGRNYYREFLVPLFFQGFAQRAAERSPEVSALLGDVPYLNGGLFLPHQIEQTHGTVIAIENQAFTQLFDFFDGYHWHLDERPLRDDNEINPDVLGYIFEKYINQKQMGAYYTKEDITEYISKNTIIPYLFDTVRRVVRIAFEGEHTVWDLLVETPDRYIYDAVRHGTEYELPHNIAIGVEDVSQRGDWNTPTPPEYGLPTEIWRETVARRQRYFDIRQRLAAGEVREINDLITLNLDIQQFAQDVLDYTDSADVVRAFWKALNSITVLDPTCGSGAFLFAALNILEPLYDSCLERMAGFVDDWQRNPDAHPQQYSDFRQVLDRIAQHPNRRYFILKSIIIQNLYGVDIMEEAVEIAKLRLFLKLVAQVEHKDRIEPLPDIDFNIRAGNTLVGFATQSEVKQALTTTTSGQGKLVFGEEEAALAAIKEKAADVDRLFGLFRQQQTELGGEVRAEDKAELQQRLAVLEDQLNRLLARQYGIDSSKADQYARWQKSHEPFHWFVEFYGVLKNGGFDVTIGNPPYVEYSKVRKTYTVFAYETENCGNLYAYMTERSFRILNKQGRLGFIVPLSLVSTERMGDLQKFLILNRRNYWLSNFDVYPSKLFDGAKQRLTITLSSHKDEHMTFISTRYMRWKPDERPILFPTLAYNIVDYLDYHSAIPKAGSSIEVSILQKLQAKKAVPHANNGATVAFYVHRIPYNYVKAMNFTPYFWNERDGEKKSEDYKPYYLIKPEYAEPTLAALNSNLFFLWWYLLFEGYHCGRHEVEAFPLGLTEMDETIKSRLMRLADELMKDYRVNSERREAQYRTTGKVIYEQFTPRKSKHIIDEIDVVLARHYGFTDEELDFIINYDIKYRMGDDLFEDDEGDEE